jgi:F-box/leucine-rich repeat protein 2/20
MDYNNDTFMMQPNITDPELCTYIDQFRSISSLDLSFCRHLTDAGIVAVAQAFPTLDTLYLTGCDITDRALVAVGSSCVNLTTLHLLDCHRVTNMGFEVVARGCRQLRDLNLARCEGLTEFFAVLVAQYLGQLTSLTLECTNIGDTSLAVIVRACPHLTYLDLSYCGLLTDSGLIAVSEHCPNLQQLDISNDLCGPNASFAASRGAITATSMRAIGKRCRGLTHLGVKFNKSFTPKVVIPAFPNLTHLDLSDEGAFFTDAGLRVIARKCPKLVQLQLPSDLHLTPAGLLAFFTSLPKCAVLR